MKLILQLFANIVALIIIIYVPFAFVINQWNPSTWNIYMRSLFLVCYIAVLTYGFEQYKKK